MTDATLRSPTTDAVRFTSGSLYLTGEIAGAPAAPHVLLLHGGGQTRHSWRETQASLVERGLRVTSVDLRGHGQSCWSDAADYSLDAFVEDIVGVIDALDAPVALVGASLGGLIGIMVAGERAPERCWALALVDVAPRTNEAGRRRIIDFMRARPEGFASIAEAADDVERYARHRERPREAHGLRKNLRLGPDGRWRWHWDPRMFDGPRPVDPFDTEALEQAARKVAVPTLLVRGADSDVLTAHGQERFLELVPDAETAEVGGAGHMIAGDANVPFSATIVSFLERTAPTPTAGGAERR